MFKNYLRIQPAPVQLLIFISFWCALMLLGMFIAPMYIRSAAGIAPDQMARFVEQDMYRFPNIVFVSNALFQLTSFLIPALVFAYLADPSPRRYLGGVAPGRHIQIPVAILLAPCLIFALGPVAEGMKQLDLGNTSRALDEQRDKFIQAYLRSGSAWTTIKSILLIAVLPAFCEELFFRGLVMKFAYSFFRRWWLSVILSAAVFSFFHSSISEFLPIFLAGVVLGWVYYLTGSIWTSILLHLAFNATQALAAIYGSQELDTALDQPAAMLAVFGIATALTAAGLYILYRKRTPLPDGWSVAVPETVPADEERGERGH